MSERDKREARDRYYRDLGAAFAGLTRNPRLGFTNRVVRMTAARWYRGDLGVFAVNRQKAMEAAFYGGAL